MGYIIGNKVLYKYLNINKVNYGNHYGKLSIYLVTFLLIEGAEVTANADNLCAVCDIGCRPSKSNARTTN